MSCQLYRHFDADGLLLYVGISLSAAERLRQHRITSAWFRRIANISVEHFDSEALARAAEAIAIKKEKPIFNKRGVGAIHLRLVAPIPASFRGYLERHDLTQQAFAGSLGVSTGLVWQWLNGHTRITAEWAIEIEKISNGEITRSDLRPDVWGRAA